MSFRRPRAALAMVAIAAPLCVMAAPPIGLTTGKLDTDEVAALVDRLRGLGIELGAVVVSGPTWDLRRAELRDPSAGTDELFDALVDLEALDEVRSAGQLLSEDGSSARLFRGRFVARFSSPVSDDEAARVARDHGFESRLRLDRDGRIWRFFGRLDPTAGFMVTGRVGSGPTTARISPVVPRVTNLGAPAGVVGGAYHAVPRLRERLAVAAPPGLDFQRIVDQYPGSSLIDTKIDEIKVLVFPDKTAMEDAFDRAPLDPDFRWLGPVVSVKPLAYLSDQIVVRFRDEDGREMAQDQLDAAGLRELRRLPYLEDGYLYATEGGADLDVYDTIETLVGHDMVLSAVPNLVSAVRPATGDTSCLWTDDGSRIYHQDYLAEMGICEARTAAGLSLAAGTGTTAENVTVGLIDTGVFPTNADVCDGVRTTALIDFDTMDSCVVGDPTTWCDTVANPTCSGVIDADWDMAHANEMAFTMAASYSPPTTDTAWTNDLVSVAPGINLINAKKRMTGSFVELSEVRLADALWWVAGGDPGWVCDTTNYCGAGQEPVLPAPLGLGEGADIINLSFARSDFLVSREDCSTTEICQMVCQDTTDVFDFNDDVAACDVISSTLKRLRNPQPNTDDQNLREGGVLVVNAVGLHGSFDPGDPPFEGACFSSVNDVADRVVTTMTDLAESPWTVAVGSVPPSDGNYSTGPPFEKGLAGDCLIHFGGDFVDVVAPLGGKSKIPICQQCMGGSTLQAGESSAAAAAVSGIAALMLQTNPKLTADQMHCILRSTADPLKDSGERWNTVPPSAWNVPAYWSLDCPLDCPLDCILSQNIDGSTAGCESCNENCAITSAWEGDRNDWIGYGMVQAEAAVTVAAWCAEGSGTAACPWPVDVDVTDPVACIQTAVQTASFAVRDCPECPECPECPPGRLVRECRTIASYRLGDPIPPWWREHIRCLLTGRCRCIDPLRCLCLDITGRGIFLEPAFDVELCVGRRCRTLEIARTLPQARAVRVFVPADREILGLLESRNPAPVIRVVPRRPQ